MFSVFQAIDFRCHLGYFLLLFTLDSSTPLARVVSGGSRGHWRVTGRLL